MMNTRILQKDMEVVVALMRTDPELVAIATALAATPYKIKVGEDFPFYLYGREQELNSRLVKKATDSEEVYNRYPLIALRMPFVKRVVGNTQYYSINMAIMYQTSRALNDEQRTEEIFIPILYPLYELFFKCLRKSGKFMWDGRQQKPEHTVIERMYWGRPENPQTANVFSDPIDAIEILDLKINSQLKC